jgi:hypothetical protein
VADSEGAKVMLTRNLWNSKGLVNGQGIVKNIWFDQGHSHLPAVIFVKFEGYSGPETLRVLHGKVLIHPGFQLYLQWHNGRPRQEKL